MDLVDMYTEYPHIGNEFLTWMWFKMDTEQDFQFAVGNKIVFSKDKESVTISGEESELIIGKVAMTDGYVVTAMQIVYSAEDPRFVFTMKGADLSFNGLKTPKVEGDGSDDDYEGMLLEKIYLVEEVTSAIDSSFKTFILDRIERSTWDDIVLGIKKWINEG